MPANPSNLQPPYGGICARAAMRSSAIAFCTIAALAWTAPAALAEEAQWGSYLRTKGISFGYGTPHTDHVVIEFFCNIETRRIETSYSNYDWPFLAEDGDLHPLILKAGEKTIVLDSQIVHLDIDDRTCFVASGPAARDIADLLNSGDMLNIRVMTFAEEISLVDARGVAGHLFLENCLS